MPEIRKHWLLLVVHGPLSWIHSIGIATLDVTYVDPQFLSCLERLLLVLVE